MENSAGRDNNFRVLPTLLTQLHHQNSVMQVGISV
jgi:hypothetical protein